MHVQLQQNAEEEEMMLSTPDVKTPGIDYIATDEDVDAALDDLEMTLTGDEDGNRSPMLNKCPELRGYHLVYQ